MNATNRWIALILVLAVALRIGVALYLGDTTPPAKDETSYSMLAERVATGHGYSFATDWYPFAQADKPTSHWSFLYTALVAGTYAVVGVHPLAMRLMQALICGLLLPWLTWRLSLRIFPSATNRRQLSLLAATLAAVYAYFVLYGAMVQTEALFICTVVWSLERALALDARLAASGQVRLGGVPIALGVSLGIAVLLRQSILPWLPVLILWLLITGWRAGHLRSALSASAIFGLITVLFIVPFTLRNLNVYQEFLLLNSNTGYAMYSAQHPMHGVTFQSYAAAPLPLDLEGKGLNEAQWDKALMQRGIQFILAEPGRYGLLSLSRVRDYFEFWPTADSSLLFNAGRLLSFTLLLPFMLLGIWVAWTTGRADKPRRFGIALPDPVALVLVFAGFYSILHILTWAMTRYRLPVDAVMLPFAALGLLATWHWLVQVSSQHAEPTSEVTNLLEQ